jgi:Tol biopolymer transport system component
VRYDAKSHSFTPYLSGLSAAALNFSRDGKWITYVAYPEGTLWRSKVDGSERLQLTSESQFKLAYQPRWSPNGRQIAFMGIHVGGSGEFKVYVTSPDGGIAQKLLAGDRDDADPNWSPDGNSILFGRFPPDEEPGVGSMDLEILDLRSHTVSKVPGSEGLWSPRWSPDGRYIVALTTNYDRIMLFDFNSGKWTELAKISALWEEWSTNGDSVNFIGLFPSGEEGLYKVVIADHKLQEVVPLKEFRRAPGGGGWAGVTPDGAPLIVRNAGTQDIYALDVEWP